jgi:hypothetical protein
MSNHWKHFMVSFYIRDCFYIEVNARSRDEAIARAQKLYDRHGAAPEQGFCFDISDGGNGGWDAEEVQP